MRIDLVSMSENDLARLLDFIDVRLRAIDECLIQKESVDIRNYTANKWSEYFDLGVMLKKLGVEFERRRLLQNQESVNANVSRRRFVVRDLNVIPNEISLEIFGQEGKILMGNFSSELEKKD